MSGYEIVLALHVLAVLGAYGLPLAYPLMLPWLRRHHPRSMPGVHAVQRRLNLVLTGPGTALVLAFGMYLAVDAELTREPWVHVGFGAIGLIAVLGGWIVGASGRMAELAGADVAAAGPEGEVRWSAEYEALWHRYVRVEVFLGLVVLAAVFAMTAKPG